MSQENVEVVRRMFEAFGKLEKHLRQGDLEIGEPYAEDVELDFSAAALPDGDDGRYRGREGVRRFWMNWLSAWKGLEFSYELRDGGDCVVALIDQSMRSSKDLEIPVCYAQVYCFRDDQIVRWTLYWDQAEALEAAGLSESGS